MGVLRRESGPMSIARGYVSQVHPVFMLPALASSAFGAVLAESVAPLALSAHLVAVFAGLYTAHLKDGYVDFHVRDEDDDHPLTAWGCQLGLACAAGVFLVALAVLFVVAGVGAVVLTAPGWFIGFFHAPQLDTHPVTASGGYPAGISLALLGGYYVQAGSLAAVPVAFASVFLFVLAGIKVVDDATDYEYDRSIDKRTVAVVVGRATARRIAFVLMGTGLAAVLGLAVVGVFPPSSVGAVVAFGLVATVARRADPELATMLFIRGSYVFLAILVAAVWFRPLA